MTTTRRSNLSLEKKDLEDPQKLYKTDPTKFLPKLYNFKVPKDICINESVFANSPPFWVLVDHLIGVVWKLYSKEKDGRKLGIIQLQWALEFIKMIKDDNGNLTKTLEGVKNTIEDALILKYASLPLDKNRNEDEEHAAEEGKKFASGKNTLFEGLPQTSQSASFSLRDVMSRKNKHGDHVSGLPPVSAELPLDGTRTEINQCTNLATPKPSTPPGETMKLDAILKYLIFLKKEQIIRIAKERKELERIEDAINQVEAGHFDIEAWVKKNEDTVKPETSTATEKEEEGEVKPEESQKEDPDT